MSICSIENCTKQAVARGWCPKHWWRWRNHGSPLHATFHDVSDEERFWGKVDKTDSCWFWKSARRSDGYGAFTVDRRQVSAHRHSYALSKGSIPAGMVVMHSCDQPLCVNPDHLSVGTSAQNAADAARKGRRLPGSKNHQAKLTEKLVLEMRARYAKGGISQKRIAEEYGVSPALVGFIVTRKLWKHI